MRWIIMGIRDPAPLVDHLVLTFTHEVWLQGQGCGFATAVIARIRYSPCWWDCVMLRLEDGRGWAFVRIVASM
jgi:hypothetical protein